LNIPLRRSCHAALKEGEGRNTFLERGHQRGHHGCSERYLTPTGLGDGCGDRSAGEVWWRQSHIIPIVNADRAIGSGAGKDPLPSESIQELAEGFGGPLGPAGRRSGGVACITRDTGDLPNPCAASAHGRSSEPAPVGCMVAGHTPGQDTLLSLGRPTRGCCLRGLSRSGGRRGE
jgi:hypothetical protein